MKRFTEFWVLVLALVMAVFTLLRMSLTNYAEVKILDHSTGKTAFTKPGSVFISLHTADPTEAGLLTAEISGNAYARQEVVGAGWNGATGTPSIADNVADIVFPEATPAGWGAITHIGVCDALTAGNMIWYGQLTAPKTIGAGDQFKIKAGELDLALD